MSKSVANSILQIVFEHGSQLLGAEEVLPNLRHFGAELIPGLVMCLSDTDPELRRIAMEVLAEFRPDSDFIIPKIVESLGDENMFVRHSAYHLLNWEFGPMTKHAIPLLETWLESECEYEKIFALTGIVRADPTRTELLSDIWDSTQSDNPLVREIALEYYGVEDDPLLPDGTDSWDENGFDLD